MSDDVNRRLVALEQWKVEAQVQIAINKVAADRVNKTLGVVIATVVVAVMALIFK